MFHCSTCSLLIMTVISEMELKLVGHPIPKQWTFQNNSDIRIPIKSTDYQSINHLRVAEGRKPCPFLVTHTHLYMNTSRVSMSN